MNILFAPSGVDFELFNSYDVFNTILEEARAKGHKCFLLTYSNFKKKFFNLYDYASTKKYSRFLGEKKDIFPHPKIRGQNKKTEFKSLLSRKFILEDFLNVYEFIEDIPVDCIVTDYRIGAMIAASNKTIPYYLINTDLKTDKLRFVNNSSLNKLANKLHVENDSTVLRLFQRASKIFIPTIPLFGAPSENSNDYYCGPIVSQFQNRDEKRRNHIIIDFGVETYSKREISEVCFKAFIEFPFSVHIIEPRINKMHDLKTKCNVTWHKSLDIGQLLPETVLYINCGNPSKCTKAVLSRVPQIHFPGDNSGNYDFAIEMADKCKSMVCNNTYFTPLRLRNLFLQVALVRDKIMESIEAYAEFLEGFQSSTRILENIERVHSLSA